MGFISSFFGNKSTNIKALIDAGAVIIDVRSPEEFAKGHIKGSRNIPLQLISSKTPSLLKEGKPVITCCRSGARSAAAQSLLFSSGIEAYNGGAWDSLNQKIKS